MKKMRAMASVSVCAVLFVACGSAVDGSDAQGVSAQTSSASEGTMGKPRAPGAAVRGPEEQGAPEREANAGKPDAGGSEDGGASPSFFQCEVDSDCVAVRQLDDCCYNGWQIAVARSQAERYLVTTACPREARHVCPMYVAIDERVPTCVRDTCVMVLRRGVRPETGSTGAQ
jgi:hypothetical protein